MERNEKERKGTERNGKERKGGDCWRGIAATLRQRVISLKTHSFLFPAVWDIIFDLPILFSSAASTQPARNSNQIWGGMLGGHNACVYPVQTEKQAGWKPVTSPPASASPRLLMTHCQMVILFLLNGDSLQFDAHHGDLVMTGEIVCSIFALLRLLRYPGIIDFNSVNIHRSHYWNGFPHTSLGMD